MKDGRTNEEIRLGLPDTRCLMLLFLKENTIDGEWKISSCGLSPRYCIFLLYNGRSNTKEFTHLPLYNASNFCSSVGRRYGDDMDTQEVLGKTNLLLSSENTWAA
jgi:hypothetical protein